VSNVEKDGPVARQGIRIGDILIRINHTDLKKYPKTAIECSNLLQELQQEASKLKPAATTSESDGKLIELELLRLPNMPRLDSDTVIICSTEHRTQIVADAALRMGLPYVPFRAVFAEGDIFYGDEGGVGVSPALVDMVPLWLSVGDYDNIYGIRHLSDKHNSEPALKDTGLLEIPIGQLLCEQDPSKFDCGQVSIPAPAPPAHLLQILSRMGLHEAVPLVVLTELEEQITNATDATQKAHLQVKLQLLQKLQTLLPPPRQMQIPEQQLKALTTPGKELKLVDNEYSEIEYVPDHADDCGEIYLSEAASRQTEVHIGLKLAPSLEYVTKNGVMPYILEALGSTVPGTHADALRGAADYFQHGVTALPGGYDTGSPDTVVAAAAPAAAAAAPAAAPATGNGAGAGSAIDLASKVCGLDFESEFFHVDSAGKTCFSSKEAELTAARIREMQLLRHIKGAINGLDLHLPQQKSNVNSHFCNESVYGEMKVVMVTGIVRLERLGKS
jgi:hypothetical protein